MNLKEHHQTRPGHLLESKY